MSAQYVFTDTAAPSSTPSKYGRIHIATSGATAYINTGIASSADWKQIITSAQLATGVATFLATPSSVNLKAAVTDETGSGALVFANTPTLVTPVIGAATGTSLVVTGDITAGASSQHLFTGRGGLSASSNGNFEFLAADAITPGAIITGTIPVASVTGLGTGVGTFLATPSSANLKTAVTDETGSGALVFANTPTLVTPVIGAATGTSLTVTGDLTAGASSQHLFTGRGGLSATADGAFSLLATDVITAGSLTLGAITSASVTIGTSNSYLFSGRGGLSSTADGAFSLLATNGTTKGVLTALSISLGSTADVNLLRNAANSLSLRNSTSAQELRISNTYTDASNSESGLISWQTTANVLTIGTIKAGTGVTRAIEFQVGGLTVWTITTSGNLSSSTTLSCANVQSTNGFSTTNSAASFSWASGNVFTCPSDGIALFRNAALTGFTGIKLGGTTSSFIYIKVNSTTFNFKLADDSAFAAVESLSYKSGAPSGGTAGVWKLGTKISTGTSVLDTGGYVELDIGGTLYKVALVTNS